MMRQPASGLSIRAWCEQQGVTEASFYVWRRTLAARGMDQEAEGSRPRLVAVDVQGDAESSVSAAPLQLAVADVRIEVRPGLDGETLARLLSVLWSGAPC
ncbi:MAG TPA: hypothetical protein PKC18_06315 [Lacipirellulaceae bacterium]|nr:hypothetical protein [Lacipirellulaceae bacterium]